MTQQSNPTMKMIAQMLGVTVATVSMALRNSPRIREETRLRVREAAKELGYRPNPMVSALMNHIRTSRSPSYRCNIAFLTHITDRNIWEGTGNTYRLFFDGAKRRGEELGYKVDHFWVGQPGIGGKRLSMILRERGIHGLIVGPVPHWQRHMLLDFENFSCVSIGYSLWKPELHRICNHQYQGALVAARELRRRNYKRIAVAISAEENRRTYYSWYAGLAVAANNYIGKTSFIFYPGESAHEDKVIPWIEKVKPDAVLSASPKIPQALLKGAIKVPDELGLLDLDCLNNRSLEVSGIDQDSSNIGGAALEIVVAQIQRNERGIPESPQIVLTSGKWVEGKTLRSPTRPQPAAIIPKLRRATQDFAKKSLGKAGKKAAL